MASLKDKVSKSKMDWADLIFLAEAEREWFEEVTVTTLKSHYENLAYQLAWEQAESIDGLDSRARSIMNSGKVYVQEYIKVDENSSVEICLDRTEITDEVVEEALDLLIDVGITPNAHLIFGEKKTFISEEIIPKPK